MPRTKFWPLFLFVSAILILNVPVARATVGVEYLGPYPLRPQPASGNSQTLQATATVGNSGNQTAIFTLTLLSDQQFKSYFTYTFSANNFTLNPGVRKDFTLSLTVSPNHTPAQNYTAVVSIVSSPLSKTGMGGGSASVNVPVAISAVYVPELPSAWSALLVVLFTGTIALLGRRSRPKTVKRESTP